MEREFFQIKQTALLKALLFGHLINIVLGIIIFSSTHWLLQLSTEASVIATIVATMVVGTILSALGTKRLSKPITALHQEISSLHEKVNVTNAEVSVATETTQALLEDLPLGCLVFNSDLTLIRSNNVARTLLGLQPDETKDIQLTSILERITINNKPITLIEWIMNAKKSTVQAVQQWSMAAIQRPDSNTGVDVIAHYNSHDSHNFELVMLFVDRNETYQRREKEIAFISLAAHELRGPITIVRGLVDILQQELGQNISNEHKTILTRLAVSARQLSGYVDNILNASRIEKEEFEVKITEASWDTLLKNALTDLNIRALAHHRKLSLSIPDKLPNVAVDPGAILHVINNLVDNAIKYSQDNGSIIVSVTQKGTDIETVVQDTGIGIPANVVENLFTKFYRSHRSKKFVSGTGLGLFLSKAIIEAHSGTIWIRSTEGVGTTVGFTLPTFDAAKANAATPTDKSGIIRGSHGWIKNHALYRR